MPCCRVPTRQVPDAFAIESDGLSSMEQTGTINLYAARYKSGRPYEPVCNVLLKEYLPPVRTKGLGLSGCARNAT